VIERLKIYSEELLVGYIDDADGFRKIHFLMTPGQNVFTWKHGRDKAADSGNLSNCFQ
jgi:hypothetical protein